MILYVRKNIKGYYVELPEKINPRYWQGMIGTTYQDFLDGKWVELSSEQADFKEEHPNATVKEVIEMHIPERTLEDAKREKLQAIDAYDKSDAVNGFNIEISGQTMTTWLTPDKRSNYKNSIDAAELVGLEVVHPVFNGIQLEIPTQTAKMALAQIQLYADRCFIVTETHKENVNALDTIEAVDAYNNETGYPEKLTFSI